MQFSILTGHVGVNIHAIQSFSRQKVLEEKLG